MRRVVSTLAVGLALLAVSRPASAQQEEEETGQLGPGDTAPTTTLAEEPIDPGDVVVVDPTAEPPSTEATIPTTTTLPVGCVPPLPPQAVFSGTLVAHDSRTARFQVDEVRSGSLQGWRAGALVDVDFFDDIRFLQIGEQYVVAVEVDLETGRLESKVKPVARLFGGDQVVGVDDPDVVCPESVDPVITRMIDGTSIETGILTPLIGEKRDILWSFARPALIVVAVLVALVLLKHAILGIAHVTTRAWRNRSGGAQPGNASSANARSSPTA